MQVKFKSKKQHSAAEHVIYNILRGYPANRGFTPITNKNKLNNGQLADQGFDAAKQDIEFGIKYSKDGSYLKRLEVTFGEGIVTDDILKQIQEMVK